MHDAIIAARWSGAHREQLLSALLSKSGMAAAAVETETMALRASEVAHQLREAAPAMLDVPGAGWIGLHSVDGGTARLLAPDLRLQRVALQDLCDALCADAASRYEGEVDRMLAECDITGAKRENARRALLAERIRDARLSPAVQLRVDPGSDFVAQARRAGLVRRLAVFLGAHAVEYACWLLAWWTIGKGAMEGRLDQGWLLAWALLLATMVPLRMLMMWSQGVLAVGLGGLLKQRLLAGALRMPQDTIRSQGAGQLLGRAIEAETVESLALSGGLNALLATVELVLAAFVLASGAGGATHALLFALWVAMAVAMGWRYAIHRREWTVKRLAMTHDTVEQMTGHRTRLAQEPPARRHESEDQALDAYMQTSQDLDRWSARLSAVIPRGWVIAGLAGMAPAFVGATGAEAVPLAISLGGVMLAWRALHKLTSGASQLAGAWIAWQSVEPLFQAAAIPAGPAVAMQSRAAGEAKAVIEAHDLTFRYRDRGEPVLRGASLRIERGDWVLLEGESGGGKSTLASLLVGLREAASGLLLTGGLDHKTLGEIEWRRRIVAAPQYHENHVLAASFAFNVLMGRQWPPAPEDFVEAETVCRELGLGPLLERMPGGMQQMVGDTGWQLSQGERSRLFIARALLQGGDLVVLDESFAALDPENLRQSLECVLRRAKTLLVVAHP